MSITADASWVTGGSRVKHWVVYGTIQRAELVKGISR